ncbi:hypothetical protein I302_106128 [Kwoniella bestiolae CBS 10118]|uniref:Methyltransferase type 11 domain-containing protein n=1 Tax=Kwoniella bestiolae CBS 10118 TaxID=1296100 RepID=A0AAJ8KB36_9TREE
MDYQDSSSPLRAHSQHYASQSNDEDDDEIESRHSGQNNDFSQADYFVEAERTYNNASWVYRLPADHEEVVRQDRLHYILLSLLPGLYRGPGVALDYGSRRWPNFSLRSIASGLVGLVYMGQMADETDITPLQHDSQFRNCTFMQVNAPAGLRTLGGNSFDVVNIRQMLHATDEYPSMVKEAHRLLRTGGILLVHEPQLQLHSAWEGYSLEDLAPCLAQMIGHLRAAYQYRGIDTELFSKMDQVLVEAGFDADGIDVYYHYRQACSEDPHSEVGMNEVLNAISFLYAARLMILETGVIDEDGFDQLMPGISDEVSGRSRGIAGPLGAQGMLSPWGYWWVIKGHE